LIASAGAEEREIGFGLAMGYSSRQFLVVQSVR
jgi:hypothetical protein